MQTTYSSLRRTRTSRTTVNVPASAAAALLALGASLPAAASVFSDDFNAYPTGTGTIAGYNIESNWEVVNDPTFGSGAASGTGYQRNIQKVFPVTTPAVGDTISVRFDYLYTGAPVALMQANFVRFGLYDSQATVGFDDDVGYHADVTYYDNSAPGVTGGFYEIRHEANTAPGGFLQGLLLDNDPGVLTAPSSPATSDGNNLAFMTKGTVDGVNTIHTAKLQITRTATGMDLSLFLDNMAVPKVSVSTNFAPLPVNFDTFNLESPANTTGAAAFRFDNLVIETSAVPEPREYALVAGGALAAFGIWRRRRHARA